jgi:hypothetical protein
MRGVKILIMKIPIFIVLILFSAHTQAETNLCSGIDIQIEPDMQIPEAEFTKKGALKALDILKNVVESEEQLTANYEWINSHKILRGYYLRSNALIEYSGKDIFSKMASGSINKYCNFRSKEAFWYD